MIVALIEIRNEPEQQGRNGIEQVKDGKKVRRCAMVAELTKDDAINALARLSKDDLREVAMRASFLLDGSQTDGQTATKSGNPKGKADDDALQDAYAAFSDALRSSEGSRPIPLALMLRSGYGAKFRKMALALARLIREDFNVSLPVERLKIAKLIVGLAAGDIERDGYTISLKTLVDRLKNPAAVVDNAFPMYRASGLLSMLVKRVRVK